jgi:hypothetical protein
MIRVQRETLQMLVSFPTPFKNTSLQLEAEKKYATLLRVLSIRFNLIDHLCVLVSGVHLLAELKKCSKF